MCTVSAERTWTLETLQEEISSKLNMPRNELDFVSITILRRSPEQAHWFEVVEREPQRLAQAPPEVRADPRVVRLAVRQKPSSFAHADDTLKNDAVFCEQAVKDCGSAVIPFLPQHMLQDTQVMCTAFGHCGSTRTPTTTTTTTRTRTTTTTTTTTTATTTTTNHYHHKPRQRQQQQQQQQQEQQQQQQQQQ